MFFRSALRALQTAAAACAFRLLPVFPVDIIVLPHLMHVCPTFPILTFRGAGGGDGESGDGEPP